MKKRSLILSLFLLGACTKDHPVIPDCDGFVFGIAYGECGGDCARLYQISGNKLYPDNILNFYTDSVTFDNTPLPDSSYQHAQSLPGQLPDYLTAHPNRVLGCPDCYDQGVLYVEVRRKGGKTTWRIDTNPNALPAEILPFVQQVKTALDELR